MKKWLLLLGLGLLLVFILFRERYTNYEEALKDVGQTTGYVTPRCEDGYAMNGEQTECSKPTPDGTTEKKDPVCPEGTSFRVNEEKLDVGTSFESQRSRGVCEPTMSPAAAETPTSTPAPTETPETTAPPTAPTTPMAPTGMPYTPQDGAGKNVWGPVFPGYGETTGGVPGDSTKTANYPVLYGGFPETGNADKLDLPSSASLGSDENSGMFPFSRQPGDMDLVPNPYKGGFTSAPSSGREPVPFLTDFSAFMK